MNNRPVAQSVGWNLGILSGLFAALQVMISTSSARANIASIESMRWSIERLQTGGGNPVPLIGSLAPVVLITYAAMIVTGAISLGLCWYAGRVTAFVEGRRDGGAGAGFRVALLSGGIWIVFSIIISLLLHADGTLTGVLTSSRDGSNLAPQLGGLLLQEAILAAIGLGLGSWAGYLGARSASLPSETPLAGPMVAPVAFYGMYPAYPPIAGYHANGSYPITTPPSPYAYPYPMPYAYGPPQPTGSVPPSYPPPPDYYRPAPDAFAVTQRAPEQAEETGETRQAPAQDEPGSQPPTE